MKEKDQENNQKGFQKIIGIGMTIVIVFTAGLIVGRSVDVDASIFPRTTSRNLDMGMFWRVLDLTRRNYVDSDEIVEEDLVYGSIKGMVDSIGDPATVFLTPEETEEYNAASEGKFFEGIGAELGYDDGQVIVVTPLEGSPAKAAGIRPGDYILKIDDYELTSEDTVYDAVAKIRGEAGTEVVLTVLHQGESELVEIAITRDEITIPSMSLEFIGANEEIAHFKIGRFTEASYDIWVSEWDKNVREIVNSGVDKVILDLRGNPGGFFDAAIYAGDDFLGEGFVISKQKDANGNIKDYSSTKGGDLLDTELIILIDSGSASASEILAGALKQAGRGILIGKETFGKGTAQRVYDLEDGSSLHLTILKWLLPDGSNIERDNAITPDIEIELTNDDFIEGNDPQLDKAIEELSK
ncbi:MAG: Carboxyl-terminal protease [candidate division WS6 bacterium 36_33]|uniref:Carboxyl-terminal protease n=1 Tax=candidate division WS6 bacterium 36_33 TaxID=1641388 RepID=A0A101H000_9BACT|nr:MAG: Carboxyl-terminal protease [candidate division WS6 bacterium 36_33]